MKNFRIKYLFIIFIGVITAQTDSQIRGLKNYINKTGMSKSEIKKRGLEQGYTSEKIEQGLKTLNLESLQGENKKGDNENIENALIDINFESDNSMSQEVHDTEELLVEGTLEVVDEDFSNISFGYFGYDIFKNDPSLFQSSLFGAIDPDYLISPGDEIIFMLWGETQFRQVTTVNREGFIFIPEVGQVFVNGLNLKFLESKLFKILSKSYESLNPQEKRATTFLDVSLGKLRPLRIQVLGEVAQPGAYTMNHSSTIFSSLYYFNGPTNLGSLRDIRLIRNNKIEKSIDFYDFLLTGKKVEDEKLQIDDVIFIPNRGKTVSINGEINRPGIYELKESETLIDLITIASDLKSTAYLKRLQIDRVIPFHKRDSIKMERVIHDLSLADVLDGKIIIELLDMDIINIESILKDRQNVVQISGAISRPGQYDINSSSTILQLIQNSGGLQGDAYLDRLDIVRTEKDFTKKLIKLNINRITENDSLSNIDLNVNDEITVYSLSEMNQDRYVFINGHVYSPGRYPLIDGMRLYDIIFQAGGLQDSLYKNKTYTKRADLIRKSKNGENKIIESFNLEIIFDNQNDKSNILLQPEDLINIYSKSIFFDEPFIEINGSVKSPGKYIYKLDMDLKDLVLEAGGFSPNVENIVIEISSIIKQEKGDYSYKVKTKKNHLTTDDFFKKFSENTPYQILKKYDIISIRQNSFNRIKQKTVTLKGHFNYPGKYTLKNSNELLSNLIVRSGGLTQDAFLYGSKFLRKGNEVQIDIEKILKNPGSKFDMILNNGDEVIIEARPNIILISGFVNAPGYYKFREGLKVSDYIKMGGGVSSNGDLKNIFITYPNGGSKKYNRIFGNHKVLDGSILVVNAKEKSEPFDMTDYLKEVSSIIANFAQVISIIIIAKS